MCLILNIGAKNKTQKIELMVIFFILTYVFVWNWKVIGNGKNINKKNDFFIFSFVV